MMKIFRSKILCKNSLVLNRIHSWLLLMFLGVGLPVIAFSSETSSGDPAKRVGERLHSPKGHAVVIGINVYDDPNTKDLKYAANDAESVANLLKKLGYQITENDLLFRSYSSQDHISKERITKAIHEVIQKTQVNDRVVVFIASSGSLPKITDEPKRQKFGSTSGSKTCFTESSCYNEAQDELKNSRFGSAREKFKRFRETYPESSLSPNALYWIGETYYDENWYGEAIETFQQVVIMYPLHPKVPDALLKIGHSNEQLKDITTAKAYWREVIRRYPKSHSAKLAQKKRNKWK